MRRPPKWRRGDVIGKPFGELRAALDAGLCKANLEPSLRAQQRQVERQLRERASHEESDRSGRAL
jgi:hypothetical protein